MAEFKDTATIMKETGLTKWELSRWAHMEGQTYAFRRPGGRKIWRDMEKFERARKKYAVR